MQEQDFNIGDRINFIAFYIVPNKFDTGFPSKYEIGDSGKVIRGTEGECWYIQPDKIRSDGRLICLPKEDKDTWKKCIKINKVPGIPRWCDPTIPESQLTDYEKTRRHIYQNPGEVGTAGLTWVERGR